MQIFTTSLIDFNFMNFFFFGFGVVFLTKISTILLQSITFLNLLIFFFAFLLVLAIPFLFMQKSITLLEINNFLNLVLLF